MTFPTLGVRVAGKAVEAIDVVTFELVDATGAALPPFSAGAHIDVHLPNGIIRQYSLCNDPDERHRYVIGVLRDPASRGGSRAMHDSVREGDVLQISAPKNHFPLAHDARRSLLLAAGTGVTPILCMAERLAVTGADFEMHYCTRSPARTAFHRRIRNSAFAPRVKFHFSEAPHEQRFDVEPFVASPEPGLHLYVCGPKRFMDAVLGSARAQGWPEAQLHYEFFSAEPAKSDADTRFEVRLASSGRSIEVPAQQTVVEALAAAGVEIPTACGEGVCGTCLTRVLAGEPDHRDAYLTPEEQAANDQFLPCCSRARSPLLVLDL